MSETSEEVTIEEMLEVLADSCYDKLHYFAEHKEILADVVEAEIESFRLLMEGFVYLYEKYKDDEDEEEDKVIH